MKYLLISVEVVILLAIIVAAGFFGMEKLQDKHSSKSELFFEPKTAEFLKNKFLTAKEFPIIEDGVKILIVPGHDDNFYGAKFIDLLEKDLTAEIGEKLFEKLSGEAGLEVFLTRDSEKYHPVLENYFDKQSEQIEQFIWQHKKLTQELTEQKLMQENQIVSHNEAAGEVALKLYGINRWVGAQDFDLVLHLHFNDYPRKNHNVAGKYSGFSIYIPESQLSNHKISLEIAEHLRTHLEEFSEPSNLKIEKDVIIEDQELIAIGSNNTIKIPSILIEYGYIYEKQFVDPELREEAFEILTDKTVAGLLEFFQSQ